MSNNDHLAPTPFDLEAYNEFKRAVASRGLRPSISNVAGNETLEKVADRERLAVEVEYWLGVIGDRLGPDRRFSDTANDLLTVLRGR